MKPSSEMFRINWNMKFKIILVILITITLLIGFQYFQINLKIIVPKVSRQTEFNLVIENLLEAERIDLKFDDLAEQRSNIALKYYKEWNNYTSSNDWKGKGIKTCDTELPSIKDIDFNNIFWQTIPNTNKTQYFLYNAFYDNRGTDKYVRVVAA